MITVREISDKNEKQRITRVILEALTEWFEVEESREQYIKGNAELPFFAAYNNEETPVGFLSLKETGKDTVEICVTGVLKEYQGKGAGRALFEKAKEYAVNAGYLFMQVKTVKMGVYDDYDATNRFYLSVGFKEFEVIESLWDEANPCQIYVMYLQ